MISDEDLKKAHKVERAKKKKTKQILRNTQYLFDTMYNLPRHPPNLIGYNQYEIKQTSSVIK